MTVLLDIAGSEMGGARRWVTELDAFAASAPGSVRVVGRGRRLSPGWLARRETIAGRGDTVIAANNVSFGVGGQHRRVLVRNALHFLYPAESDILARMPRSARLQVHVVRRMLERAELIVVPCAAMAARVAHHVPSARRRLAVRAHPVTPGGVRRPAREPFLLVPVLPAPYKNLVPQLRALIDAQDRIGQRIEVRVTAGTADLPGDLADRVTALGSVSHRGMEALWRSATAVFFPSTLESFGYPLAEARVHGVPVLSPDSEQAREIAGAALLPYDADDPDTLAAALERIGDPVPAEPGAFDPNSYFRWLFEVSQGSADDALPSNSDDKSGRKPLYSP